MEGKERFNALLDQLTKRRESLLEEYLKALEVAEWNNLNSMKAVENAGKIHDIDRHITNIMLEIKRLESIHAS